MNNSCSRGWEVEALADGRLNGADEASFRRHLASCAVCRRKQRELENLQDAVRAIPSYEPEPLLRVRQRAGLLREANQRLIAGPRPRRGHIVALASTLVGVVACGAAAWHHAANEADEALATNRVPTGPLASEIPLLQRADASFTVATPEASGSGVASRRAASVVERPATRSAGVRFDEAMHAYSARDFALAEVLFFRFTQDFASDPRSEDASFLRAVARAESGDKEGAASLARAYLERYPNGFRRAEAQRLAGATP